MLLVELFSYYRYYDGDSSWQNRWSVQWIFLDESKDCVMYDGDKAFCKDDIITVNGFTGDIILGAVKTIPKGFKFVYC